MRVMRKLVAMALLAVLTMAGVVIAAENITGAASVYEANGDTVSYKMKLEGLEKQTNYELKIVWGTGKAGMWKSASGTVNLKLPFPVNGFPNPLPIEDSKTGMPIKVAAPPGAAQGGAIPQMRASLYKTGSETPVKEVVIDVSGLPK